MRLGLLVLLVLSAPLAAQAPPDSSDARRPAARAELYIGGLVGSYVLTSAISNVGGLSDAAEGWGTLLAIPAGAALGVVGTGRLLGFPGSPGRAARGAAQGALLGVGLVMATVMASGNGLPPADTDAEAALWFVVVGAVSVLPTVLAARGYSAAPVRVRASDGTTAPGVALRVRL